MSSSSSVSGLRIRKLRLFTPPGGARTYDVDFTTSDGNWRPLSIVAGASQTGKTSTIEYILYCLGGSGFPEHPEMVQRVAAAALELEIDGVIHTIERTTTGSPSKFASVRQAPLDDLTSATEMRLVIDPPSEPESLSQFLLASFGMGGIRLPVSPSRPDSETHALSIRDVARLMYYANSRLDGQNLLEEKSNVIVAQKLQQTIDLTFGVADNSLAQLADRIHAAEIASREAERSAKILRAIVEDEYPLGPAGVEIEHGDAQRLAERLRTQIAELDTSELARQRATDSLRGELAAVESEMLAWNVRVRGRESLLDRLNSLALQYADDKKKLTFLKEAERLFDPLHVTHCPACLNKLTSLPHVTTDGSCSFCGHDLSQDGDGERSKEQRQLVERELTATTRRLDHLTEYLNTLTRELVVLRASQSTIAERAASTATELNRAANLPAPFLAYRDQLSTQLAEAQKAVARQEQGNRLWEKVGQADRESQIRAGQLALLRKERQEQSSRPDRNSIVSVVSARFVEILGDFGYPKLSDAGLNSKFIPTVRGSNYTRASSGGLTLISLAWAFAIWEVAFERDALAPGLLIVDSPQKNLGHTAHPDDDDFADARLVNNIYEHIEQWLDGAGAGAQIILVDNSPPPTVDEHVVIRFSGRAEQPPFGLIDDATT